MIIWPPVSLIVETGVAARSSRRPNQNFQHRLFLQLVRFAAASLCSLGLLLCGSGNALAVVADTSSSPGPNIAFYYGHDLPVDELQAFDVVVIDPSKSGLPRSNLAPHTAWFARVNLKTPDRLAALDANAFVRQAIAPLWNKGFRGFLLDDGATLAADATQDDKWLGSLLLAIRAEYPESRVMLRNHLTLAQSSVNALYAIVVDSLYQKNTGRGDFLALVSEASRQNALKQIQSIRDRTPVPIIAVDYCAIGDLACRRDAARRLGADGFTPFVTTPDMASVGIGRIEVMPRKILMIQAVGRGQSLDLTAGAHSIAMPLNYLGYDIQYVDLNEGLPSHVSNDRYAGIVVSIDGEVRNVGAWRQWLLARIQEGLRVAVFGQFGFPINIQSAQSLGLTVVSGTVPAGASPQVISQASMMGFEIMPEPDIRTALGIRVEGAGQSLLRLKAADYIYDAAGIMPWGGFVLDPYAVVSQAAVNQDRWAIQPIAFLKQALMLPDMPVPDLTSENGRRLMFTHVDGDGFASQAEFSSARGQYSGQVLNEQIFSRYPIPMSVSVIEGEISAAGLYPQLASRLEPIARRIFALPNVEIASHTFSHPFNLEQIDEITGKRVKGTPNPEWGGDAAFSMDIPKYVFDVDREIRDSIAYINKRLAPPGKKVEALFWPGNAAAPKIALRRASESGVLNINGGDTTITRSNNSWTNIAPYGVAKGNRPDEYQVYASTMNENVYTNDWLGPYYGYDRVLETFAMTDKPIRFKALDIYYHFYSGTKAASLKALHTVFDAVLKQAVFPIYATDYIKRAMEWRRVVVARDGNRWIVRSGQNLRQLRWPGAGNPSLATASGVAGYLRGSDGLYIHMGGDQASFTMAPKLAESQPYINEASGFVRDFKRAGRSMEFQIGGYYKPFVQLANIKGCTVSVDGKRSTAGATAKTLKLNLSGHSAKPVSYHLVKVECA